MFEVLLQQVLTVVIALSTFISGSLMPYVADLAQKVESMGQPSYVIQRQSVYPIEMQSRFGAINFVAGNKYRLSGSGVGTSDTSITLDKFQTPDGIELAMTDFGDIAYATIEPGSTKKEFISFTGVSQSGTSDKATLTGVTRGLRFVSPYTASSSLALTHSGGSVLIISNPPQLYNELAAKDNDETIKGTWTFASTTIPKQDSYLAPTADEEFAPKAYVDDVATSGAANASRTVKGLVEIATLEEMRSGTSTGSTGALLVPEVKWFASTSPGTSSAPFADTDGYLDQSWFNYAEAWSWTASTTMRWTSTSNLFVGGTDLTSLKDSTSTVTGTNLNTLTVASTSDASDLHYHPNNCLTDTVATSTAFALSDEGVWTITFKGDLGVTPTYLKIDAVYPCYDSGEPVAACFSFGTATSTATSSWSSSWQSIVLGATLNVQAGSQDYIIALWDITDTAFAVLGRLVALNSTGFTLKLVTTATPAFGGTNDHDFVITYTVCK